MFNCGAGQCATCPNTYPQHAPATMLLYDNACGRRAPVKWKKKAYRWGRWTISSPELVNPPLETFRRLDVAHRFVMEEPCLEMFRNGKREQATKQFKGTLMEKGISYPEVKPSQGASHLALAESQSKTSFASCFLCFWMLGISIWKKRQQETHLWETVRTDSFFTCCFVFWPF